MSERYFLDTNALLNAVFVDNSWSRKVVALGAKNQATFVTGERTLEETKKVLAEIVLAEGAQVDLMPHVASFISQFDFDQAPGTLTPTTYKVPNNDQHVVEESTSTNSYLVTSDADLIRACTLGSIPVICLLNAVRRFEGATLGNLWYGVWPQYDSGLVYCRAALGPSNPHVDRKQTLFHATDWLWLYYDNLSESWCAEFPKVGKLSLPSKLSANASVAVSVSWSANAEIVLRASGAEHPASLKLHDVPSRLIKRPWTLGHTIDGQHYFGCPIYVNVFDDRPISSDSWRKLKHLDASIFPDPFDRDRLVECIRIGLK